eukprot:GHRR01003875.1.p1 GENE.GHRR01003875.1~~GHRR01003875.1.p1  ORF type:complete len:398 (+),score=120.19 GHRR01003875.1:964-2157(+)
MFPAFMCTTVSDAPYVNGWFSPYMARTTEHLTLWQRLNALLTPIRLAPKMMSLVAKLNEIRREIGIKAHSSPPADRHKHALKLINTFIGFETARPIDPMVQLIGPIRSNVDTALPADLQDWLDGLTSRNSTPRVVYVAFGSHADAPATVITGIVKALEATLQAGHIDGVIWAVSGTSRDKFPADLDARILLVPFAPQKALLAHPAVCLFISHGGAESSHEAIYEGKPVLFVPFFADQPMNAAKLREQGMAEAIRHTDVTAARVQALLDKMLNPASLELYVANARRLQALVHTLTRYNTAAAADMLEFFAHYGWDHLVDAGSRMPWYRSTNADIYAVGLAAVLFVLYLSYSLLRVAFRLLSCLLECGKVSAGISSADGRRPLQQNNTCAVYDLKAKAA